MQKERSWVTISQCTGELYRAGWQQLNCLQTSARTYWLLHSTRHLERSKDAVRQPVLVALHMLKAGAAAAAAAAATAAGNYE
jgi:hypothetical protein